MVGDIMNKCSTGRASGISGVTNPPTSYPFLPDELNIMGHTWKLTDMNPMVNHCNVEMQVSGYCGAEEQEIAILPDQKQSQALEILFHEILEALNGMMTLGLEHDQIQLMALGFFQVLYGNGFLNLEERLNPVLEPKKEEPTAPWPDGMVVFKGPVLKPEANEAPSGNLDAEFRKNYKGNIIADAPGLAKNPPTQLPMR
jgi:hypothetical protein